MVALGIIAAALECVYVAGSAWVIVKFRKEWRSLKRGIVTGQLTDRNMDFMDALVGDDNPFRTGFVAAVIWPKFLWDEWRSARKDRT